MSSRYFLSWFWTFLLYSKAIPILSLTMHESLIQELVKLQIQPSKVIFFYCKNNSGVYQVFKNLTFKMGTPSMAFNIDQQQLPNFHPPDHEIFVMDLNCDTTQAFLNYANEIDLFRSPYRWIILDDTRTISTKIRFEKFRELFQNINIFIDSDVILVLQNQHKSYKLFQPYKIHKEIFFEKLGFWAPPQKLSITVNERILSRRRRNLKNLSVRAVIVVTNNETMNHLTDYKDPHIDTITKVNYILLEHVAEMVHINLTYMRELTWGYRIPNTTDWTGLIGQLHRKEAQIGGTALFLTPDRIPVIQYIAMGIPTRSKFVFRQPKLSYVTNVYQLPFASDVWIGLWVLMALCSLAFINAVKWEVRVDENFHFDGVKEVVLVTFGAMCQQGASLLPNRISGRIIAIFLFASLLFLYTSYSATIVSLLQTPSKKINTLEDLLTSRLELGVHDTVFNRFYFPSYTDPTRKGIYEKKVAPPGRKANFLTMEEGINRMRAGLFAFHFEEGSGYKRIQEIFYEDEKCGLKDIQFLQVTDPLMSVQKNLSYLEHFKIAYRRIQENGFSMRETNRLYTKKPKCESHGGGFIQVSLIDCYPLAVYLCIGIGISILIFLIELYLKFRTLKLKPRHAI